MNPNPGGVVNNATATNSRQQAMLGALLRNFLGGASGAEQGSEHSILPMLIHFHQMFTQPSQPGEGGHMVGPDTGDFMPSPGAHASGGGVMPVPMAGQGGYDVGGQMMPVPQMHSAPMQAAGPPQGLAAILAAFRSNNGANRFRL